MAAFMAPVAAGQTPATETPDSMADTNTHPAPASAPTIGLKDAYAGKFLVGGACDFEDFSDAEWASIRANYAVITPGNSMKPGPIHPSEDQYNWTSPDRLVQWCEDNHIKVWGHTLCWHSQTGPWFFGPGADGQPVTRELAMARLKIHILTEVGHYKGRVMGWDVVNESATTRLGAMRAANGHPEPYGVKIWGMGNEMYGPWQLGHIQITQYPEKHNLIVKAMRKSEGQGHQVLIRRMVAEKSGGGRRRTCALAPDAEYADHCAHLS
jgi:hypothetical protein